MKYLPANHQMWQMTDQNLQYVNETCHGSIQTLTNQIDQPKHHADCFKEQWMQSRTNAKSNKQDACNKYVMGNQTTIPISNHYCMHFTKKRRGRRKAIHHTQQNLKTFEVFIFWPLSQKTLVTVNHLKRKTPLDMKTQLSNQTHQILPEKIKRQIKLSHIYCEISL